MIVSALTMVVEDIVIVKGTGALLRTLFHRPCSLH